MRAWVVGIARNVFREWARRRARVELTVADPPEASLSGPDADRASIEDVLGSLPAEFREVLIMRFVLDLSSRDAAAALGLTDDAVRQRVARARAAFAVAWGGDHG